MKIFSQIAALLLHCALAQAGEMATVGTEGRADQPTGTTGEVLIQETEVEASPCGNPESINLSEENLPTQTDLMHQIAEKDEDLNGSTDETKECMTKKEGCGYWFVHPHEPLDGEENEGDGKTLAIEGYSRSLPEYVMNFRIFDQKRYHESAETVAGLAMRNATDEAEAQKALATKLKSLADRYQSMLKAGAPRIYPYHDLPVTVASLYEYSNIAEKRAELLSIVACHTRLLAEKDHALEEEMREKLTSLVSTDLKEIPAEEKPAVEMGNSGLTSNLENGQASEPAGNWKEEIVSSFASYRVARKPAAEGMHFTEEDSLFVRVNHQMRKRELPGLLGPLPMGIGSVDNLKINHEFQLERY